MTRQANTVTFDTTMQLILVDEAVNYAIYTKRGQLARRLEFTKTHNDEQVRFLVKDLHRLRGALKCLDLS